MEQKFEDILHEDLHRYLHSIKEVDERMPECPDVEEKWAAIAQSYLPDGIREFQNYPNASLGWMMYVGMAMTVWMNIYARMYCCLTVRTTPHLRNL